MAIIASPIDLAKYRPFQPQAAIGDTTAATIEALKGNPQPAAGTGLMQAVQNLKPEPLQVQQPKVSPDTSVQLQTSASALNPAWAERGINPPDTGNSESYVGRVLNKIRGLGPDWKDTGKGGL